MNERIEWEGDRPNDSDGPLQRLINSVNAAARGYGPPPAPPEPPREIEFAPGPVASAANLGAHRDVRRMLREAYE